jgi:hypothetical protein
MALGRRTEPRRAWPRPALYIWRVSRYHTPGRTRHDRRFRRVLDPALCTGIFTGGSKRHLARWSGPV